MLKDFGEVWNSVSDGNVLQTAAISLYSKSYGLLLPSIIRRKHGQEVIEKIIKENTFKTSTDIMLDKQINEVYGMVVD